MLGYCCQLQVHTLPGSSAITAQSGLLLLLLLLVGNHARHAMAAPGAHLDVRDAALCRVGHLLVKPGRKGKQTQSARTYSHGLWDT